MWDFVPNAVVKLARKRGNGSPMDMIRGVAKKDKYRPGLMEQQHPLFWGVPFFSEMVNVLCTTIPANVSSAAEERVIRAIIGHTWRFNKAAEFITWDHFKNGKFEGVTGEMLVAPARVSGATLMKAIRSATSNGLILRQEICIGTKELFLYLPNPLVAGGKYHLGRYASYERYSVRSTYSSVMPAIQELRESMMYSIAKDSHAWRPTRLYRAMVDALPSPELIACLFEMHEQKVNNLAVARHSTRDKMIKGIPAPYVITEEIEEGAEEAETKLEAKEMAWFNSPAVTADIVQLRHAGNLLNSGQFSFSKQPDNERLPMALIHRLGVPLLAFSPNAWKCAWAWREFLSEEVVSVLEETKEYLAGGWYCKLE